MDGFPRSDGRHGATVETMEHFLIWILITYAQLDINNPNEKETEYDKDGYDRNYIKEERFKGVK